MAIPILPILTHRVTLLSLGAIAVGCKAVGWDTVAQACEALSGAGHLRQEAQHLPEATLQRAVDQAAAAVARALTDPHRAPPLEEDECERLCQRLDTLLRGRLPRLEDLIAADLDWAAVQHRLRAAIGAADRDFAPDTADGQFAAAVLSTAFDALTADTALTARMRLPVDAAVLQRLTALAEGMTQVQDGVGQLQQGQAAQTATLDAHTAALDSLAAGQAVLPAQIVAALDAHLRQRADAAGLERRAMLRVAARLRPEEALDFDQAVREVEHAVEIALDVIARGERRGNLDAFVEDVLTRLAALTRAGDADAGSRVVDDALRDLDRQEVEQRDAMRRNRSALLEAGIEQDTLRRDAPAVAARIEALVALDHPAERPTWTKTFRQRWDTAYETGRDQGTAFPLELAAALAERMLAAADNSDERGLASLLRGAPLATLGERESGTTRLEQAVEAFRATLAECTRGRDALNWATTQNNLGCALACLGVRDSATERLEEAVEAFRAALLEYSREYTPLDWAGAQNNLGAALTTIGERKASTEQLEQAVEAFRAALLERTRDRVPLDWAMTQNNLGTALTTLGEWKNDNSRLEQAVEAYRAALLERMRERAPLAWATTQNNLGTALAALGERGSGTARLEQAAEAYREALMERTRERVPLNWATTQNNLANVLACLGERVDATPLLKQAGEAYCAALLERTRERVPLDWATTQNNLGNVLLRVGERESDTERLEQAVEAYRAALLERTRERVPLDWATTQNNLGNVLLRVGERESGTARLEQAVEAYRAALLEYTRERVPLNWAYSQHNLANALATIAARRQDPALLRDAIAAMRNAAEVFREGGNTYWLPVAEARIAAMQAELAAMGG